MFFRWGNDKMKMEKKIYLTFPIGWKKKTHDVNLIVRFCGFANVSLWNALFHGNFHISFADFNLIRIVLNKGFGLDEGPNLKDFP
jgi:hypothetical protein